MDHRARYDSCCGHKINLFCFFSSSTVCPYLDAPFLSVNFLVLCFRLPSYCRRFAVALPSCCLLPSPLSLTRLWRREWRVSVTISRLSGQTHRLQQRYLPSGAHLPWSKAWGKSCHLHYLAMKVVSDLFDFRVCADFCKRSWVTGGVWWDATAMPHPEFLVVKDLKRERGIGWDLIS